MNKNYLIYPLKNMRITQDYDDRMSHYDNYSGNPKDYPIDDAGADAKREYFYAPCDEVIIKRIYGVGNKGTNTIWLESTSKVATPTFTDYVTIMVIHPNDDTLKNLKVGQKFKRKQKMFLEGNDGNASGYHFHISVARGKFKANGWVKNSKGVWVISGEALKPEECFYIDSSFTKVINDRNLDFISLPRYVGSPVPRDKSKDQIEILIDNLRCRKTPKGEILGYINKGIYNVIKIEEIEYDFTWYEVETNKWIAYDKSWATIYKKEALLNEKIATNEVLTGENITSNIKSKESLISKIFFNIKVLIIDFFVRIKTLFKKG